MLWYYPISRKEATALTAERAAVSIHCQWRHELTDWKSEASEFAWDVWFHFRLLVPIIILLVTGVIIAEIAQGQLPKRQADLLKDIEAWGVVALVTLTVIASLLGAAKGMIKHLVGTGSAPMLVRLGKWTEREEEEEEE